MKTIFLIPVIFLFVGLSIAKPQNIDTVKTEIHLKNTRLIGGINLYQGNLYLLLKANSQFEYKITQASEFYDLKQKYPDWYIYKLDTLSKQVVSKLDTAYLPMAIPKGFCIKPNLAYYVAQSKTGITKQYIASNPKKSIKFKSKLALPVNESFVGIGYPFLSRNADTLYFSAYHIMGYGKLDIWYMFKTNKGWSEPVNAGKEINTEYDEIAPYFAPNNDFYFASNRQKNKGFDIYKRYYLSKSASCLSNKVNTTDNEIFYCPINNESAYLVSDQKNTSQLFLINSARNNDDKLMVLKGEKRKNLEVTTSTINHSQFELSEIKNKEIVIDERSLTKTFELAQTQITSEMNDSLVKMNQFLENNPGDKLLICGHASPDGPEYINMELSIKRANGAYNWLIGNKQLNAERIFRLYGGEYVYQDTISARNFSMFTAISMTLPPLIAAFKLIDSDNAEKIFERFQVSSDMIELIQYELKKFLPMNDSSILYLPVRDVHVTKTTEKAESIALQYAISKHDLMFCNNFANENIAPKTIVYIPEPQSTDDEIMHK